MGTVPVWILIVSILSAIAVSWIGAYWTVRKGKVESEKHDADKLKARREENRALVRDVIREVFDDRDFNADRDQRIKEIANTEINEQFKDRASSFVDKPDFERFVNMILDQHKTTNALVIDLARQVGEMDGRISSQVAHQVTTQLTAYLSSTILTGRPPMPQGGSGGSGMAGGRKE